MEEKRRTMERRGAAALFGVHSLSARGSNKRVAA